MPLSVKILLLLLFLMPAKNNPVSAQVLRSDSSAAGTGHTSANGRQPVEHAHLRDIHPADGETTKALDPRVPYFTTIRVVEKMRSGLSILSQTVDSSFWELTAMTLDGEKVSFASLRGKHLLLNIWGEWCKPCLKEIPLLVENSRQYDSSKVEFIGFLQANNLEKAKELIRDAGMNWKQIVLTPELQEKFRIDGVPTNILITPDGRKCFRTYVVDQHFFDRYLR